MKHLPLLTVSEARSYQSCPRQHHYRYRLGVRPLYEPEALRVGTAVHAGLEAWWLAPPGERLPAALAALPPAASPFEAARIEAMLRGYNARWRFERYETLGAELEFSAPLVHPDTGRVSEAFQLAGKLDALVRDEHGDVWVVEHKSSSTDLSPGSTYWEKLQLDTQVSTYLVGARALGYEPVGVLWDVLAKPELEPYKATPPEKRTYTKPTKAEPVPRLHKGQHERDETLEEYRARLCADIGQRPERYYGRGPVVRFESEEREAALDLWELAATLADDALFERAPRNPSSCWQFGSWCAFREVCFGRASIDDPLRFRRLDDPHEELTLHLQRKDAAE